MIPRQSSAGGVLLLLMLATTAHAGAIFTPFVRSGATWTYLGAEWDQVLIAGGRSDMSCPSPANSCSAGSRDAFYRFDLTTGQFTVESFAISPAALSDSVKNGWLYCHSAALDPAGGIDSIYFSTVVGVARLPRYSSNKTFGTLQQTTYTNITSVARNGRPTAGVSICSNLRFEARHIHESHFWLNGGFVGTGVNIAIQPFYAWVSPLTRASNMWHLSSSNTDLNILPSAAVPVTEGDPTGYSTAATVKTPDSDYNFNVYYFWNGTNQALHLYTPQLPGTFTYDWQNASSIMSAVPPREFQSMTQDADGSRIFIYGGRNPVTGATLNDLWVIWTYGTSNFTTWKVVQVPIGVTAVEPTARFAASMMFDEKRSLVYIWGGETTTGKGDNRLYILSPPQTPQLERVTWLEGLATTPPTSATSTATSSAGNGSGGGNHDGGGRLGVIVGSAVGGAAVLLVVAGSVVFLIVRRRRRAQDESYQHLTAPPPFKPPQMSITNLSLPPNFDAMSKFDHTPDNRSAVGRASISSPVPQAPRSPMFFAEEVARFTDSGAVERITVLRPVQGTSGTATPTSTHSASLSHVSGQAQGNGQMQPQAQAQTQPQRHAQHQQPGSFGFPTFAPSMSTVPPRTSSVSLVGSSRVAGQFYDLSATQVGQYRPGMIFTAVETYLPNLQDEISVARGDILVILQVFDDGWIRITNRTTEMSGFAPSFVLG